MLFGAVDEGGQFCDIDFEVIDGFEAVSGSTNAALMWIPRVNMHI